jgi:hypothetical protein
MARTGDTRVRPHRPDRHVVGYRWWTLAELRHSAEEFAPRRLGELIGDIMRGTCPDSPIDCGI